jgi:hypothetical protein
MFEDVKLSNLIFIITLEAEIAFWRSKGPFKKLYNLIIYIRKTL